MRTTSQIHVHSANRSALDFDGNGDYVQVPSSSSLNSITDQLSVGLWLYPRSTNDVRIGIVQTPWTGYWIDIEYGNYWAGTRTVSLDGGTAQANKWSHLVLTYNGSVAKLYVDGVEKASAATTGNVTVGADVFIGSQGGTFRYWDGLIDDVRIYKRALSTAEVEQLYEESGETYYFYHFDGLGSVVALSNSSGTTIQTYEYTVYGEVAAEDPNHPNPFLFTGRRFDIETGLYYYRARYYNPYIGRFLQTDPVGYGDGINWYLYCKNNPVGRVDPNGVWSSLQFTWFDDNPVHLMVSLMNSSGPEDTYFFSDWLDFFDYLNTYGFFYNLEVDEEDIKIKIRSAEPLEFPEEPWWYGPVLFIGEAAGAIYDAYHATDGIRNYVGTVLSVAGGDLAIVGIAAGNPAVIGVGCVVAEVGSILVISDTDVWGIAKAAVKPVEDAEKERDKIIDDVEKGW